MATPQYTQTQTLAAAAHFQGCEMSQVRERRDFEQGKQKTVSD